MENLDRLINELRNMSSETQWVEFKHNNYDPDMIGKNISALANSAVLHEKSYAYMLWGIDDKTHEIVGTDYDLQSLKRKGEELGNFLRFRLSRNASFDYKSTYVNGVMVGVLIIEAATDQPVSFEKTCYIRVGSYTKKLNEYPKLQEKLWDRLSNSHFEERAAMEGMEMNDALRCLDTSVYFDLKNIPQPSSPEGLGHYMLEEGIMAKQDDGLYAITNMGAILFAKRLSEFPRLARKAIRVVQYRGHNRTEMLKDEVGTKGYVVGFEGLLKYIEALIPTQEIIVGALREREVAYPLLAIREVVANALIHQDFSIHGTGPTVEIFEDRIEITNAGTPLVDVKRIIDNPPRSRNEKLAELSRRLRICEELGTSWDKIVICCEAAHLPAPKIELFTDSMRVSLFTQIPFSRLSREDKMRACYHHACIKYIQGEQLTNSSLRMRFGLESSASGSVSRLIRDAVAEQLIKPFDPKTAPKHMRYIPAWA